jgi:His/Glu/Gln/Arg/opine family amino acid ABC transporter permease subunit
MLPNELINNFRYLLMGAGKTLEMSAACIALSSVIGIIVALLQVFGNLPIRALMTVYLYINRGVPLLVLLFAMYFALPYAGINLHPVVGGILVISFYFGAFMSEIFRAAIISLPRAQWDAARSLGMRLQVTLRIIIFPQAFRLAAPPFLNTCLVLIKSTSLVSIIGLWELTLAGREVVERTLAAFQIFAGVGLIYFCICYSLSRFGRYLEERMRYAH